MPRPRSGRVSRPSWAAILTQMTFGFSRDDAAKFLGAYYENKIYESDPFQHLDQICVGKLVKMAAHDGRETRPDLGLGIWVRSLVPKLKNSASLAISPAVRAARGISIMVPT